MLLTAQAFHPSLCVITLSTDFFPRCGFFVSFVMFLVTLFDTTDKEVQELVELEPAFLNPTNFFCFLLVRRHRMFCSHLVHVENFYLVRVFAHVFAEYDSLIYHS